MTDGPPSCAGLTRASIFLVTKLSAKGVMAKRMDCRVKPGNDVPRGEA
jgi:hypothetical protein